MLVWAEFNEEYVRFAYLFLLACVFLLRLPSEALPAIASGRGSLEAQTLLSCDGKTLQLRLRRRKNKPAGSLMTRHCWCASSPKSCPVHVLGAMLEGVPPGTALFSGISLQAASSNLRYMLGQVGVEKNNLHTTHGLRRGHAKDLQLSGGQTLQRAC